MDLKLVYQPEQHFRFFDKPGEAKQIVSSINDYEHISLVTLEEAVQSLVIFIPHVHDMLKLVKEKCQQPKDNLSPDESASIMLYAIEWIPKEDSFYYILNRKLHSNDQNQLEPWYLYLKLIITSLSKLPMLSNRIFYRGIKFDLENEYYLGKKILWNEFSSCLRSIENFNKKEFDFGQTDARTLFIIHSNQGENISQHSFYKTEHEILLASGQQFQVVSYRKSKDKLYVIILKELSLCNEIQSTSVKFVNDEDYKSFALLFRKRIQKYERYYEINLSNQNLTDDHMHIIVKHVLQTKGCTWLSLRNNKITSHGLSIITNELKFDTSLESLYLSQNQITDKGVQHLTDILSSNYSNLTFLSLDYNCIKDEGAQYLADMLKRNRILTDLWLSYNEIGDHGVQSLASALTFYNTTLIQLYLQGNKLVTDACVDSLVLMLKVNVSLDTVYLQDCSFSQEGKEKLEKTVVYRTDFDLYI